MEYIFQFSYIFYRFHESETVIKANSWDEDQWIYFAQNWAQRQAFMIMRYSWA
jgi:hypothetical protein